MHHHVQVARRAGESHPFDFVYWTCCFSWDCPGLGHPAARVDGESTIKRMPQRQTAFGAGEQSDESAERETLMSSERNASTPRFDKVTNIEGERKRRMHVPNLEGCVDEPDRYEQSPKHL